MLIIKHIRHTNPVMIVRLFIYIITILQKTMYNNNNNNNFILSNSINNNNQCLYCFIQAHTGFLIQKAYYDRLWATLSHITNIKKEKSI